MNEVEIGLGLKFMTQVAPDGRQIMLVDTVDITVDINKKDIKLHIGGGFWNDLASIFEVFFKGTVVDEIRDNIKKAFETTIPDITNKELVINDGYANIVPNLWWDWESSVPALVTEDYWGFAVKGLMFDNRTQEVDPGVIPTTMPYKQTEHPAQLQGFLSTYFLDSAATSLLSVFEDKAQGWFNSSLVSDKGVFPTNTSTIDYLMPGIADYYRPNVPVNIRCWLKKVDNVRVNDTTESMDGTFTL